MYKEAALTLCFIIGPGGGRPAMGSGQPSAQWPPAKCQPGVPSFSNWLPPRQNFINILSTPDSHPLFAGGLRCDTLLACHKSRCVLSQPKQIIPYPCPLLALLRGTSQEIGGRSEDAGVRAFQCGSCPRAVGPRRPSSAAGWSHGPLRRERGEIPRSFSTSSPARRCVFA